MKMTAKFEAEGESFNACFEQLNSAFNAEFSASGGGQDGKDGATFTPSVSEDGVISWTNDRELPNPEPVNIKGKDGKDGIDGKDGKNGVDGKDGADGITPVKGIDYFTEQDVEEIAERAAEMVDVPEGGSGVTSWNDLTDKPFGEMPPIFDISWDGDMTGHDVLSIAENQYVVKVSDEVFTKEQLLNSTTYCSYGDEETFTEEDIYVKNEVGFISIGHVLIVFSAETLIGAMGLPEGSVSNGVWFLILTGKAPYYVERFIASSTIKTIDNKYLDLEGFAKTEDLSAVAISGSWNDLTDKPFSETIETSNVLGWDRNTDNRERLPYTDYYKVSNDIVSSVDLANGGYVGLHFKNVDREGRFTVYEKDYGYALYVNDVMTYCVSIILEGATVNGLPVSPGIYFWYSSEVSYVKFLSINGYTFKIPTIKTLDEKFLPETVVLEGELTAKGYQTEAQVTALIDQAIANLPRYNGEVEEI